MINKNDIDKANVHSLESHTILFEQSTNEHTIVGQSEQSHVKRLEKMFELADFSGRTILDVGCGLGAFYKLLKEREVVTDYYGIDINPKMIDECKGKYSEIADHFSVFDLLSENLDRKFDYIIALGVINLDFGGTLNLKMTEKLIAQIHNHAQVGYAIGMTSSFTRKPQEDTFYYKPEDIISYVGKHINNFKLDHSYLPHDFTVFCYKDDFYTK